MAPVRGGTPPAVSTPDSDLAYLLNDTIWRCNLLASRVLRLGLNLECGTPKKKQHLPNGEGVLDREARRICRPWRLLALEVENITHDANRIHDAPDATFLVYKPLELAYRPLTIVTTKPFTLETT